MSTHDKTGPGRPVARPQISLAPRRTPKRSELIARDMVDYIVDSELEAGTPLPPEHEMIESMGVGRTTLREALRLLETRGVLTIKSGPGGGPIVRRPRPGDLSEALTLILQFEGSELIDVVEARRWLESTICRLAASQITPSQVDGLREINQEIYEHPDDEAVVIAQNAAFHNRIGQVCGNAVLRVFLEAIISVADGSNVGVRYGRKQGLGIAEAHERIIVALEAGDADAAGSAMDEHLDDSQRYWRRRYSTAVKQPVHWVQ